MLSWRGNTLIGQTGAGRSTGNRCGSMRDVPGMRAGPGYLRITMLDRHWSLDRTRHQRLKRADSGVVRQTHTLPVRHFSAALAIGVPAAPQRLPLPGSRGLGRQCAVDNVIMCMTWMMQGGVGLKSPSSFSSTYLNTQALATPAPSPVPHVTMTYSINLRCTKT